MAAHDLKNLDKILTADERGHLVACLEAEYNPEEMGRIIEIKKFMGTVLVVLEKDGDAYNWLLPPMDLAQEDADLVSSSKDWHDDIARHISENPDIGDDTGKK